MPFYTQTAPKVLTGPLASLPAASGIPDGFFYHATDGALTSFILRIDPGTGTHFWDTIGGAGGSTIMKWSGGFISSLGSAFTSGFIADQADLVTSALALRARINQARTLVRFGVTVVQDSFAGGQTTTANLIEDLTATTVATV